MYAPSKQRLRRRRLSESHDSERVGKTMGEDPENHRPRRALRLAQLTATITIIRCYYPICMPYLMYDHRHQPDTI